MYKKPQMKTMFENGHALLIGVGDDLPPSVTDAKSIHKILIDPNLSGYNPDNVHLLINEQADRNGILNALDQLISTTDEESTVFVYYSGHGGYSKALDKYYFCPNGFSSDTDKYENTWLQAKEFQEKMSQVKAEIKVLFLDCCHAQGMTSKGSIEIGGEQKQDRRRLESIEKMGENFFDVPNLSYISACRSEEKSWILPNATNSLFTQELLKALNGEHKTEFDDPFIRVTETLGYVLKNVPPQAKKHQKNQHPSFNIKGDRDLILTNVPTSKRKKGKTRATELTDKEKEQLSILGKEFELIGKQASELKDKVKATKGEDAIRLSEQLMDLLLKRESFAKATTMIKNMENANIAEVIGDNARIIQGITGDVIEGDKKEFHGDRSADLSGSTNSGTFNFGDSKVVHGDDKSKVVHGNDNSKNFSGNTFNGPITFGNTTNENIETKNEARKIVNQKADKIVNIDKIDDATFNL